MKHKIWDGSHKIDLVLNLDKGEEWLTWSEMNEGAWKGIGDLDPDAFAALCIVIRRAANEREKVNGYRVKLEES